MKPSYRSVMGAMGRTLANFAAVKRDYIVNKIEKMGRRAKRDEAIEIRDC
jgi:hypothetical protein